jgi:hypothetical protein
MEDVLIYLPYKEVIQTITIGLEDDACVEAPTPYLHPEKIVYYGSSITEGAHSSKPANAYNALISRWPDVDYYNMGFSGAAKGELAIADYLNTIPTDIFVYDYDYNAPNADHLARTHGPFFHRIRKAHPNVAVVILTRPDFDFDPQCAERREIIRTTWENARNAGDQNVWFVDGETLYGKEHRDACTCDTVHPNDIGMYRMAQVVAPVIEGLLGGRNRA